MSNEAGTSFQPHLGLPGVWAGLEVKGKDKAATPSPGEAVSRDLQAEAEGKGDSEDPAPGPGPGEPADPRGASALHLRARLGHGTSLCPSYRLGWASRPSEGQRAACRIYRSVSARSGLRMDCRDNPSARKQMERPSPPQLSDTAPQRESLLGVLGHRCLGHLLCCRP